MSPEAWCELGVMVAMDDQTMGKYLVGDDTGLGQAIHDFLNLNIHMTI
jgi:hypothetical protein